MATRGLQQRPSPPALAACRRARGHSGPRRGCCAAGAAPRVSAAAEEDPDAALEARLAAFKGARSWKQEQDEKASSKAASAARAADKPPPAAQPPALDIGAKPVVDWGSETVFFDAPPSRGDLVVNVLLGATLLWLPLSIAAVGRGLWVRYKVTDKRVSVASTSPFGAEELNASYGQMTGVVAIGRGVGVWGDMVISLADGSKIEIRSIDRWAEGRIADARAVKEAGWEDARQKRADAKL